jgi:hypothetical protein
VLMGGNMAAEKAALEEANSKCAQQNKQFMAIGTYDRGIPNSSKSLVANTNGGYQINFRCLNSGDPGLAPPTPTPAPSIVIQDQRRQ